MNLELIYRSGMGGNQKQMVRELDRGLAVGAGLLVVIVLLAVLAGNWRFAVGFAVTGGLTLGWFGGLVRKGLKAASSEIKLKRPMNSTAALAIAIAVGVLPSVIVGGIMFVLGRRYPVVMLAAGLFLGIGYGMLVIYLSVFTGRTIRTGSDEPADAS